jgi:hypothetical protein
MSDTGYLRMVNEERGRPGETIDEVDGVLRRNTDLGEIKTQDSVEGRGRSWTGGRSTNARAMIHSRI